MATYCTDRAKTRAITGQSAPLSARDLAENQGVTNRIQSLLGVRYPVVQAPMTYIANGKQYIALTLQGGQMIALALP